MFLIFSSLDHLVVSATIPVQLPPSPSNDTLDSCSVDSMSLDEHIEIKIPESRIEENRRMLEAQNSIPMLHQNGDIPHIDIPEPNGIIVNGNHHDIHAQHNHINETHRHLNGLYNHHRLGGSDLHLPHNGILHNGTNGNHNHIRMYRFV